MARQRLLPFEEDEDLRRVWELIPVENRREAIEHLARLVAQRIQKKKPSRRETSHGAEQHRVSRADSR